MAGNRHDGFDEAGARNELTVRLRRDSQRKRGTTDRLDLRSIAPVLDPTRGCKSLEATRSRQFGCGSRV
jgi:hypothetical protein